MSRTAWRSMTWGRGSGNSPTLPPRPPARPMVRSRPRVDPPAWRPVWSEVFSTVRLAWRSTTSQLGATIRYTTDGTAPTPEHGDIYTQPITISTTTTLWHRLVRRRAVAQRDHDADLHLSDRCAQADRGRPADAMGHLRRSDSPAPRTCAGQLCRGSGGGQEHSVPRYDPRRSACGADVVAGVESRRSLGFRERIVLQSGTSRRSMGTG